MIKKDFYEWLQIGPDNLDKFAEYIPEAANSAKDRKSFGCMMFYFKLPGWYDGQMIGVAKDRCISIINCDKEIGDLVNIKILESNNNLYIGELR